MPAPAVLPRINREKTIFLAALLFLLLAALRVFLVIPVLDMDPVNAPDQGGAWTGPSFPATGEHRVKLRAPASVRVTLLDSKPGELEQALAGARQNPFTAFVQRRMPVAPNPTPHPQPVPLPQPPVRPTPPRPPEPRPQLPQPDAPVAGTGHKAYEVPVNFRGVEQTADGRCKVILEIKATGEHRHLGAGDVWPDTGLTIVDIAMSRVILRNAKGETFVMLDLYGSRVREPGLP
jgi:hypothetical protein